MIAQVMLLVFYNYTNTLNSITGSDRKVLTVGVGPENLNNSTLAVGSQPVINADVSYYTVQLVNNSNSSVSEIKRIDIDNRKYKYNTHRLWWLNRLGGFDSYHFNLKDKRKVDVQRTFYNKLKGDFVSGSPSRNWLYAVSDRGKTGLSVNAQGSNTFNSDWLTEAESLWLEELFTTLEVYLSDTNTVDKFCCLDYGPTIDASGYQVTIPVNETYTVGEMVYVDFGLDNYDETKFKIASEYFIKNPKEYNGTSIINDRWLIKGLEPESVIHDYEDITATSLKQLLKSHGATKIQGSGREAIVRLWKRYNFEPRNTLVEVLI